MAKELYSKQATPILIQKIKQGMHTQTSFRIFMVKRELSNINDMQFRFGVGSIDITSLTNLLFSRNQYTGHYHITYEYPIYTR